MLDLLFRTPAEVEGVMIKGFLANKKFGEIRSQLQVYATARFTDVQMKPDYQYVCFECDSSFFPNYVSELWIRLDYSQPSKDTLYINTILVDSPGQVSGGAFVDYILKKDSGKWKMHDVKYTKIGKRNFELTSEEARLFLLYNQPLHEPAYINIEFVSESEATARDGENGELYTYKKYQFTIQTNDGYDTVMVDSDSGYYEY
ncbi:hypothetical protein [Sporosarcina sp. P1]|uniref:hypothetical protein n=1 Tax=Sporosarcina sp. P1 TaxID=2048257 RepID=UPI000C168138|nr:hypothetical protein [Sporosarcina sp. P1]PIC82813.1 hypothetical protein CSV73_10175 [Sporosarcina sp. P1]